MNLMDESLYVSIVTTKYEANVFDDPNILAASRQIKCESMIPLEKRGIKIHL